MIPCRPFAAIGIVLINAMSAGPLYAQAPTTAALIGQWNFETAIGTTTTNGVSSDDIGKGVFTITRRGNGLAGTIAWLDERGRVTSARQVEGHLDATGAVFKHGGQRVTSDRSGKEFATDVTVRWTLRAIGDQLTGQRLVETDEDEPKPVTGTRVAARDVRAPAALLPIPVAAPAAATGRGPSTPEERARVVRIAEEAERSPRAVAQRDGAWLEAWVNDIPDLVLDYRNVFAWLERVAGADLRVPLRFQYLASAMAFQVQHPDRAGQQSAVDSAGMAGLLRAYQVLVGQNGNLASAEIEQALAARDKGELPAFVGMLSGRDASPLAHWRRAGTADPVVSALLQHGTAEPQATRWLDILSNRFGGRMTGSDAYTHAAAWTVMQLRQWGIQAKLEEAGQVTVGFNRGPWSGRMVAPHEEALRFATPAYTAGTKGVQRGLVTVGPATLEEARERAAQFKDKWVLIGGRSSGSGRDGEYVHRPKAIVLTLAAAGALGTIQAAEEPMYAGTAAPTTWETLPELPDIKLAESQYGDIRKRVQSGAAVTLEFDIRNWFYPGPVAYHNVVASIPGTDKPEEVILLGAHLDSFDSGTGAADNGGGVATMLEAMRLLAASGSRPRRTIMMVAFGGEEIGLKGSSAFVARHADQLPGLVMMLNRDSRPGAITSLTIPSAWAPVFERVARDLRGVHPTFGFTATIDNRPRARAAGGRASSDDSAFASRGVPTPRLALMTDFDYERVHHTVADTYDSMLPFATAQQYSALAIAVIAHEVANAAEAIDRAGTYRAGTSVSGEQPATAGR